MLRAEHRSGNRVSAERNWFGSVEPMAEIVEHGGMYQVEIYGRIRRAVLVEGRSQRSVAREFGLARVTDRKSTRLNSSHLGSSYAVFCLKTTEVPGYDTRWLQHAPLRHRSSHHAAGARRARVARNTAPGAPGSRTWPS